MNELLFNFEGKEVEVINFNGQALFNPYDVGECLDISERTVRKHLAEMNQNQVIKLTNDIIYNAGLIEIRKLNNAGENFLTEFGVYKLIFKSRKPSAERFQDWVTDAVLPRIRQYGAYIPGNTPEQIIQNGISAMDGMVSLSKYNDAVNYYLKELNRSIEIGDKAYLDRFRDLDRDAKYSPAYIEKYVIDKNKHNSITNAEMIILYKKLGFLLRDCTGKYYPNADKIASTFPFTTFTFKGLVELCYAIDHPGEIYYRL